MKPLLELEGIWKSYDQVQALKGVSLSVREGEIYGFLGPNGAGKTSLLRILSGFLEADEGGMWIGGELLRGYNPGLRRAFGIVPQEIALYSKLNAWENCRVFANLYNLPAPEWKSRAETLLQKVGLWDRRKDSVKTYSGGMKRRLNIAVSLLHDPKILLCDEPTVGIDPQSRNAIFDFLEDCKAAGLTILYTTHYMEEAERLCERIAIMDHGEIMKEGTREELLRGVEGGRKLKILKVEGAERLVPKLAPMGELEERPEYYYLRLKEDQPMSAMFGELEALELSPDLIKLE